MAFHRDIYNKRSLRLLCVRYIQISVCCILRRTMVMVKRICFYVLGDYIASSHGCTSLIISALRAKRPKRLGKTVSNCIHFIFESSIHGENPLGTSCEIGGHAVWHDRSNPEANNTKKKKKIVFTRCKFRLFDFSIFF